MLRWIILLILLCSLGASKHTTYVYDATPLLPFEIPSSQEMLLPDHYVCKSGWTALLQPPFMNIYTCGSPFLTAQIANGNALELPMNVDAGQIIHADSGWIIHGDCDQDVTYLCSAPSDTVHWTRTCENTLLATYYSCTQATLMVVNAAALHSEWTPYHNSPEQATYSLTMVGTTTNTTCEIIEAECTCASALSIEQILLWALVAIGLFTVFYFASLALIIYVLWKTYRTKIEALNAKFEHANPGDVPLSTHFTDHMT